MTEYMKASRYRFMTTPDSTAFEHIWRKLHGEGRKLFAIYVHPSALTEIQRELLEALVELGIAAPGCTVQNHYECNTLVLTHSALLKDAVIAMHCPIEFDHTKINQEMRDRYIDTVIKRLRG